MGVVEHFEIFAEGASAPQLASELEALDGAGLVDLIGVCERLKAIAGAVQAHAELAFREQQLAAQRQAGVRARDRGRGITDQVALARRITPSQAGNQLAVRCALLETMPRTTRLWQTGQISEWAAHEVAKQVLVLDDDHREIIDTEFEHRLPTVTAPRAGRLVRARAQELDPHAAVARARRNTADRHVSIRPAGDGVALLRALLPTPDAVAIFKTLDENARSLRATGDDRSRGAIMTDTLLTRVTGVSDPAQIGVEIQLLMTDTTLLAGGDRTAWINDHPVPGAIARDLALGTPRHVHPTRSRSEFVAREATAPALSTTTGSPGPTGGTDPPPIGPGPATGDEHRSAAAVVDDHAPRWIRRLYTDAHSGELTVVDPRRRAFTGPVRRFILLHDQGCRTPWCDSPIAHIHHLTRYADGGRTTPANAAGVCARFNHAVEIPGWSTDLRPDPHGGPSLLHITTPTGHHYTSAPPALTPSTARAQDQDSAGNKGTVPEGTAELPDGPGDEGPTTPLRDTA